MDNHELNKRTRLSASPFLCLHLKQMDSMVLMSKYLLNIKVGIVESNLIVVTVVLPWFKHT